MTHVYRTLIDADVPVHEKDWPYVIMCADRRRAEQWGWKWYCGQTALWIAYVVIVMYIVVALIAIVPFGQCLGCAAGFALGVFVCARIDRFVERVTIRAFLCAELQSRGINVCTACGYSLVSQQKDESCVCPECGTQCTCRAMSVRGSSSEDGATS